MAQSECKGETTAIFQGLPLNEAHNGYIEVYLNLGWVGLGLLGLVLIDGYRRSVKAFRREPALGALLVAYVLTAITYSVTEAGFRMLDPIWIFFLFAVIAASSIATRIPVGISQLSDASLDRIASLPLEMILL